jgi:serine protease Do
MEEPERLPCTGCRQQVELTELDCPHCGASLLVDVVLQRPPSDARQRYLLTKAVQALPGAPPLWEIQRALAAQPPAIACGVTRAFAHAVLPAVTQSGARCSIEKHVAPSTGRRFSARTVLLSLAAVLLVGCGLVAWQLVLKQLAPRELRLTEKDLMHSGQTTGQPTTARPAAAAPAQPRTARELAQTGLAAAASLRCADSVGSGFFIDRELLVTNAHVLCGSSNAIQVTMSDQRKLVGKVERRAERQDVALVRVAGANAQGLQLGDVGELAVGDKVVIVGSPVGLDFTVHEGSVSSLQRSAEGVAYVQLDAKVSPGNSGGPVIDDRGRVVAMVSRKIQGEGVEGIGLALPINYVYGSVLNFVPAPSSAAARSAAFSRMLASAEGNKEDVSVADAGGSGGGLDSSGNQPLLLGASVDEYKRLVLRIVRVTEFPPGYEEVTVKLWDGIEPFCTVKGDVNAWKVGDAALATSGMESGAAAAFARMTHGQSVYVGETALRWDLCDHSKLKPGMEIELVGGHPQVNRIKTR